MYQSFIDINKLGTLLSETNNLKALAAWRYVSIICTFTIVLID